MSTNRLDAQLVVNYFDEALGEEDFAPVTATEPLPVRISNDRNWSRVFLISAAATAMTVTTPSDNKAKQLMYAVAHYSGSPTQTGVTFNIIPAAGTAYQTTLSTGSANVQDTSYVPGAPLILLPGDKFSVTAPSGGGSLTSAVTIAWENVKE